MLDNMYNIFDEINRTIFDVIPNLLYNYNLDMWIDMIVFPVIIIVVYLFIESIRRKNHILLFITS